ncbi:MAG: L-rhamnose mutarotase [Chitinophagaceae bacterium]
MKRLLRCLLAILLLAGFTGYAAEIYVSPAGADANPGSKEKPLATVAMAIRKARELRRLNDPSIAGGIHIILRGGIYRLEEPVFIRPDDSGTADSPTFIEAAPGEYPVFSGGRALTGWSRPKQPVAGLPEIAQGKIWVAEVPLTGGRVTEFRQLWINDKKAIRAKSCNGDSMSRILAWNHRTEECWIPTPPVRDLAHLATAEMFIHQWWAIAVLRVKKFEVHGDSTRLSFHQPESKIQSEHPWPAPWMSKETGNSAFYLSNALRFLDEPGEWFLDVGARKLYYWPRKGEDLSTAVTTAPVLETLVRIEGTADNPVSHFYFNHIAFRHTGWLRPSQQGHVPHQAGMYMLEAYKLKVPGTPDKKSLENQAWVGRPAAAVSVSFADHTGFSSCRFEHLASTGLDYGKGTHKAIVEGNLLRDIGGSAILAGVFSDEAVEVHIPYNPKDEREVCSNMVINNNLVTDATNEDWGAVGIGAGYVRDVIIAHNDISNVNYTGIMLGWGWTRTANAMRNNKILSNKIHHYARNLYDVAGIYTLSAQPGTLITGNDIDSIYKAPYAHLPTHWFYLYTDEGSAGMTIKDNWTPSGKFLQNANGPGNSWENNGPQVNDSIRQNAGLQPAFRYLLTGQQATHPRWPVNQEWPVVLEITGDGIDITRLQDVLVQNKVSPGSLYRWNDHYVVFDKVQDVSVLRGRVQAVFPKASVKTYYEPFYEFNRTHCDDKKEATAWTHVLLTANLVADTTLQKEYLDYHTTQFDKWPEVANGFCNAGFQRLLLYRNGRQLMLIISIPEGKSLDELNPKTTENNPRVDEWNARMKKYQEGIPGTQKGESWVFLQPVPYSLSNDKQ